MRWSSLRGTWSHGWGVPMATDTAFAIALIAVMGAHVPVELRIFLTAAAIVDDIGAIIVVAVLYSGEIHPAYLAAATAVVVALADPAMRSRLVEIEMHLFPREQQTPEVLGAMVKADAAKWWPIIKAANIRAE